MRRAAALLVFVLAVSLLAGRPLCPRLLSAGEDALAQAEQLLLAGNAQSALDLIMASPMKETAPWLELRGRCLLDLGKYDAARDAFNAAIPKAEAANDRLALGRAHVGVGTAWLRQGDIDQALPALKRGVGVLERSGYQAEAVPGYVRLAEAQIERKDYQAALSYLFMAERVLDSDPSNPGRKDIYAGIVALYEKQERTVDAIAYMEKAYREVTAEGDLAAARQWCFRLARAHEKLGDLDKAVAWQEKELDLARRLGDDKDVPGILVDLGVLCFGGDRRAEGRAYFDQALELIRKTGDKQKEADVLWQLADRYAAAEDYSGAVEAMAVCVAIEEQIDSLNLAQDRARLERFRRMLRPKEDSGR